MTSEILYSPHSVLNSSIAARCMVIVVGMTFIMIGEPPCPPGDLYSHTVPCYCSMGSLFPASKLGILQIANKKQNLWRNRYLCVHFPDNNSSSRFVLIKNQMPHLHLSVEEIMASKIRWTQPIATFFTIANPTSDDSLHFLPKLVLCFSDEVRYYAAHRAGAKKKETFVDPKTRSSLVYESRSFEGFPRTQKVLEHLRGLTGTDKWHLFFDYIKEHISTIWRWCCTETGKTAFLGIRMVHKLIIGAETK
jgi:hypothetical protein